MPYSIKMLLGTALRLAISAENKNPEPELERLVEVLEQLKQQLEPVIKTFVKPKPVFDGMTREQILEILIIRHNDVQLGCEEIMQEADFRRKHMLCIEINKKLEIL